MLVIPIRKVSATDKVDSPFFQVLADAEEVRVREVHTLSGKSLATSAHQIVDAFENDQEETNRVFFVQVKPRPEPKKIEAAPPSRLAAAERLTMLHKAQLLAFEGEEILARNLYSFLLSQNIKDWQAMRGLGNCFLKLGETTSAKKCFQALVEFAGTPIDRLRLAQCFVKEENGEHALSLFRDLKEVDKLTLPEQIEFHRDYGNCAQRLGELDIAERCYEQARAIAPKYVPLIVACGTLKLRQKRLQEAREDFEQAVAQDPNHSQALGGLGFVFCEENELERAKDYLTQALAIDSQNISALIYLMHLVEKTKDFTTLRTHLVSYREAGGKDLEIRYALAVLLFNEQRWRECQQELSAILKIDPEFKRAKSLKEEIGLHRFFS